MADTYDVLVIGAGPDERLGGHAAPVRALPADQFPFHDGHPQAAVGQPAGRVLAGRPGPDHQHVVYIRHEVIPLCVTIVVVACC